MNSIERLARQIQRLNDRVAGLARTPQLANSSIEDGAIEAYDEAGQLTMNIGLQFDGTNTAVTLSGPPPPTPTIPEVVASTLSLTVKWDGFFADADGVRDELIFAPMDHSRVEVHVSTDPAFKADSADTLRATIETPRGADVTITPLEAVPQYVRLVTRSLSGRPSVASAPVMATPQSAIDQEALQAELDKIPVIQGSVSVIREDLDRVTVAANGINHNYYGPTEPTGTGVINGDLWFKTPGNIIHRRVNGAWSSIQDTDISAAKTAAQTAATAASTADGKAVAAQTKANEAAVAAATADGKAAQAATAASTADGKAVTAQTKADEAASAASVADGKAAQAATAASAADTKAANAASAVTALDGAVEGKLVTIRANVTTAQTTANGAVTMSTAIPVVADGAGKPVNAMWARLDATGKQIANYRWTGTAWNSVPIAEAYLPAVAIGTGTYGELDGVRIKAKSISTSQLLVGSADELVSNPAFATGTGITGGIGWASGDAGPGSGWNTATVYPGAERSYAMAQRAAGTSNMSIYAPMPTLIPVNPGESFRVRSWLYATGQSPYNSVEQRVYFHDAAGVIISGATGNVRVGEIFTQAAPHPDNQWFTVGGLVTAPVGAVSMRPRVSIYYAQTATPTAAVYHLGKVQINRAASGELVVDGAITALQIKAGTLTSASGVFGDVDAATINVGTLNTARLNAGDLRAHVLSAGKITAADIVTGTLTSASGVFGTMDASIINAGTLNTARLNAGDLRAHVLSAGKITAADIVTGTLTSASGVFGTMDASVINAGTLNTARLNAGDIRAHVLSAGKITAADMVAGTLTATSAAIASLDGGKITADSIKASSLQADSINVSKLSIGDFGNLADDPSFEAGPLKSPWKVGAGSIIRTDAGRQNTYVLRTDPGNTNPVAGELVRLPLKAGDKYIGRFNLYVSTTLTAELQVRMTMWYKDKTGAHVGSHSVVNVPSGTTTGWKPYQSAVLTVPAGIDHANLQLNVATDYAGTAIFDDIEIRKLTGTTLIEDGAITTEKITVNTLNGDRILVNSLNADKIVANSITAAKLSAAAIDGRTITGSTIRTASTGARIAMEGLGTSNRLYAVNSAGVTTFNVDASTGNVDMVGSFRTGTTGARMEMWNGFGGSTNPASIRVHHALSTPDVGGATLGVGGLPSAPGVTIARLGVGDDLEQGTPELKLENDEAGSRTGSATLNAGRVILTAMGPTLPHLPLSSVDVDSLGVQIAGPRIVLSGPVEAGSVSARSTTNNNQTIIGPIAAGGTGIWFSPDGNRVASTPAIYSDTNNNMTFKGRLAGSPGAMRFTTGLTVDSFFDLISPPTSTFAANVGISSNPVDRIHRLTSAAKYKLAIQEIPKAKAEAILNVAPKTWFDRNNSEKYADWMADVPGVELDDVAPMRRIPGVVAEDVKAAGLEEFVTYDRKGEIEGVSYDRMWTLLIPLVKEQRAKISALEARLTALEAVKPVSGTIPTAGATSK